MQPAAQPGPATCIGRASVEPPSSTSIWWVMPASSARRRISRTSPAWAIMPLSRTLMAGPAPRLTLIGGASGTSPVRVTSRAMPTSGRMRLAAASAPRVPTSSCTLKTK